MNIAVSCYLALKRVGVGALIWDNVGYVMAATCCSIPMTCDQFQVDARALMKAVIFASEIGFSRLEVGSEGKDIISLLQCLISFRWCVGG